MLLDSALIQDICGIQNYDWSEFMKNNLNRTFRGSSSREIFFVAQVNNPEVHRLHPCIYRRHEKSFPGLAPENSRNSDQSLLESLSSSIWGSCRCAYIWKQEGSEPSGVGSMAEIQLVRPCQLANALPSSEPQMSSSATPKQCASFSPFSSTTHLQGPARTAPVLATAEQGKLFQAAWPGVLRRQMPPEPRQWLKHPRYLGQLCLMSLSLFWW